MPHLHYHDIAALDWEVFVKRLEAAQAGADRPAGFDEALREFFSPDQAERLEELTRRAMRLRAILPVLGNVVYVHGTACSNLATTAGGFNDLLWMNMVRMSIGQLELLRLAADGSSDFHPETPVGVAGIIKFAYAIPLMWLHARWNVRPFAYDWRKSLDLAADELAAFITSELPGQPVHLVAHSMGGMVCRNFIHRHPGVWAAMRDPQLRRGGRLVMLGTPNYGSFLATQVLTGQSEIIWTVDSADLRNDLPAVLEITNTFPANYQLLPFASKLPLATQAIYNPLSWGPIPISTAHLAAAQLFHAELELPDTIDPQRMLYVAAYGSRTPGGLNIRAPGILDHTFTFLGDFVTTLELGPLPGVPTWYVLTNHFELVMNPAVLLSLDDLLFYGNTPVLARQPLPAWIFDLPGVQLFRAIGDLILGIQLRKISGQLLIGDVDAARVHRAEQTIIETALGDRRVLRKIWQLERARLTALLNPDGGEAVG